MFELTDEERELAAMVRDFAETVVAPQSYDCLLYTSPSPRD